MEKQKVEITVTVAGAIVFIIILAGNFKKGPVKKTPPLTSPAAILALSPSLPISTLPAADRETLEGQKLRAKLPWGRDPFSASKSSKEYQMADLQLKGISFGVNKKGYAFINNEIVKSGDKVGSYEIVDVEKDKVLLKKDSQSFYLALPKE